MKILFINQYYWPDVAATAQQLTDLAEYLAERGHDVHVLCTRGLYEDQPGVVLQRNEVHGGVHIQRMRQWGSRGRGIASRILGYIGTHFTCAGRLLIGGWKYDLIVTLTDPPLVGLFGAMMRRLSFGRIKYVCWSMDLYPDCLFALGSLKRRTPLGAILAWLNRIEVRHANAIVVLGQCMRERLLPKGVKPEHLHVIGVWNRADQLVPLRTENNSLRTQHGLNGQFVVMYSGNAGRSHTFDAICQSMLDLKDDPKVKFVFVGGGKRLEQIESFAKTNNLTNFVRLPYFPREMLNESLSMGDAHLVSLQETMSGIVVPCKLYGIMGVARPVLYVGPEQSTVACEVNQSKAGLTFTTTDSAGLTAAIRRLASDPALCRKMGENGRRHFLASHERETCCAQWARLLHTVVTGERDMDSSEVDDEPSSRSSRQPAGALTGSKNA